jgi:hypothetical protein
LLARLAGKVAPTCEGLVQAARQSLVNRVDETGWRVGGVPWYLWTFVSEGSVGIGADYRGWLVQDGWAAYYRFVLAYHQCCLEH